MSKTFSLFLLVEGKVVDPYFADRICRSSSTIAKAGYEVLPISHVQSETGSYAGGKQALIAYYEYCRAARKLSQTNSTGKKCIAFLVDRDAEQITGRLVNSKYLLYTFYADSEAHVFNESDEVQALACAASLDYGSAVELSVALGDWKTELADAWRPWIELCCIAAATRSGSTWVGFGKLRSLIHRGNDFRTLDSTEYANAEASVENHSPLSKRDFDAVKSATLKKVARYYRSGDQAQLLKGKWLPEQLTMLVEEYFRNPSDEDFEWDSDGFRRSITRCYMSELTLNGDGAVAIRSKLEQIM